MSTETIERSFEVGPLAKLKLSNIRGHVDIQPGDEGLIAVTALIHLNSGNRDQTEIKIEQAADGQVIVKTDYENFLANWFGWNRPCKVDYAVRVPKNCVVRASGVSSDISVREVEGAFDLNTVSGTVKLDHLSGPVKVGSVSGAIRAEEIAGALDANSVSGPVQVMDSQLPQAYVKTVSGSITVQTPLGEGPYTFKGVSGDLRLIVPPETACTAHLHSVSGRMRTSLPITVDHRYGSRGSMEIQGGGAEVSYHSVSGSLRVLTSEYEKNVEPEKIRERPPQPINRLEILQKVESGTLSVEDALNQLNA